MSAPARQVRARQAERRPARTTPSRARPNLRVVPRASRRRSVGFWVLASFLLGSMVVGIAVTYALTAQAAFEMRDLAQQQGTLTRSNREMRAQIAVLMSEDRIDKWAKRSKLVYPASIEIINVRDAAPGGSGDGPSRDALTAGAG